MADSENDLTERVQAVEGKVDQLSASVDQRFDKVDERFNEVDRRFNDVDRRFNEVDKRFNEVDAALLEQRQYTEFSFSRLEAKMDAGFSRFERKLDQFIDAQLKTNELVDRRLRALE